MITSEEIVRLRELAAKATPPPWKLKMEKIDMGRKEFPMIIGGFHVVCTIGSHEWNSYKDERDANVKLIAAFRNELPSLLDEIERLLAAGFIAVERANKAEAELSAALKRADVLQEYANNLAYNLDYLMDNWGRAQVTRVDFVTAAAVVGQYLKFVQHDAALSGGAK
ncbi:MAG TPA: hypothetical protein DCZ08_00350 [Anaerolineaceae bacterium]|nr:hypothetical protein [Anaerolineaceae bacterium]